MTSIRHGVPSDATAIGTLVCSHVAASLVDPEGAEAQRFYATMSPSEVEKKMTRPNLFYVVAEIDSTVQGMILIRDNCHVGQFFVREAHQGKGLGSALWQFAVANAKRRGGTGLFTVNSSFYAEPIYRRFGFFPTGGPDVMQGFKFIPMQKEP